MVLIIFQRITQEKKLIFKLSRFFIQRNKHGKTAVVH